MTKPLNLDNLLPIKLKRLENGDVVGTLPSGLQVTWPCSHSTCPNRSYKRVMVNCYWWRAEWEETPCK